MEKYPPAPEVKLGLTDYHSDKVYNMRIVEEGDDLWRVKVQYGARHNVNREAAYPNDGPTTRAAACQEYDRLLRQKLRKGYQIEG